MTLNELQPAFPFGKRRILLPDARAREFERRLCQRKGQRHAAGCAGLAQELNLDAFSLEMRVGRLGFHEGYLKIYPKNKTAACYSSVSIASVSASIRCVPLNGRRR